MSWRRLDRPVSVEAFVQDIWIATTTDLVDDDTREVRVFPPGTASRRLTLDASRYRCLGEAVFRDGRGVATDSTAGRSSP